jgi:broad specificity phosphatase PhoE
MKMECPLAVFSLPEGMRTEGVERETASPDLCNSGDQLAELMLQDTQSKLVWHFRHGQSTGNAAREKAMSADEGTGNTKHADAYRADALYADTPLTKKGREQARGASKLVVSWKIKPTLIVCSALTRAIETGAIIFEKELQAGTARLIIRPEMREFW